MSSEDNSKINQFDPYAEKDQSLNSASESSGRPGDDYSDGENSEDFDDERSQDSGGGKVRDTNSFGSDDDYDDDDSRSRDGDEDSYDSYNDYGSKKDSDGYYSDGNSYSYRDGDRDNSEYYNDDEYPEEEFYHDEQDEEDRRKRSRLRRAWICCIVLLCCLLIIIILLIVLLLLRNKDEVKSTPTPRPTYAPLVIETDDDFYYDDDIILVPGVITTPMAPFNRDNCEITEDFAFVGEYRNVLDQCACGAEVVDLPPDVKDVRDLVIERVAPKFYGENFSIPWTSCEPANLAAIWLASGDNRDAGEPRQRYGSALAYYQLNGTVWDYMDGWMTPLNECLWMGIQCNNLNAMNSLALDTNNLFGPVRMIIIYCCMDQPASIHSYLHYSGWHIFIVLTPYALIQAVVATCQLISFAFSFPRKLLSLLGWPPSESPESI